MPKAPTPADTTLAPYECVDGCGTVVDPKDPGTWREVTGWVQSRKAGGSNAVRDQRTTGRYLCRWCMDARQKGVKNQGSMFVDGPTLQ